MDKNNSSIRLCWLSVLFINLLNNLDFLIAFNFKSKSLISYVNKSFFSLNFNDAFCIFCDFYILICWDYKILNISKEIITNP